MNLKAETEILDPKGFRVDLENYASKISNNANAISFAYFDCTRRIEHGSKDALVLMAK